MHTPPLHACILIHFVNEFVYDGAYGFSSRFCMAPDLFVVGFAEVDGNAGHSSSYWERALRMHALLYWQSCECVPQTINLNSTDIPTDREFPIRGLLMFRLKDDQKRNRVMLAVASILYSAAVVSVVLCPTMALTEDVSQYEEEIMREPRSPVVVTVVGTILAVLTNTLNTLSSLGQTLNSMISRLPIPDKLKDFLKFYGEELFETIDEEELTALEKAPIITRKELKAVGVSIIIMTTVLAFVEVNGFPYFLSLPLLAAVIPSVLISVCIVNAVKLLSEFFHRRIFQVYRQLKLWNYGLGAFLISGLVFLFPFSSPLITRYQSRKISDETKAWIVLSKMLMLLTLAIPFSISHLTGFPFIGDTGLLLVLMISCYSLVPLKPLAGRVLFNYRKDVSLIAFASTAFLFYSYTVNLLPAAAYLACGVVSVPFLITTLSERLRAMITENLRRITGVLTRRLEQI